MKQNLLNDIVFILILPSLMVLWGAYELYRENYISAMWIIGWLTFALWRGLNSYFFK